MWESLCIWLFQGYFCVRRCYWGLSVWLDVQKWGWSSVLQGLFVPPLSWFDVRRDAPVCCMYIVALKSCCPEFDPVGGSGHGLSVITHTWHGLTWTAEWPLLPLLEFGIWAAGLFGVNSTSPAILANRLMILRYPACVRARQCLLCTVLVQVLFLLHNIFPLVSQAW